MATDDSEPMDDEDDGEPRVTASRREVIDLSSQLNEIELHVAEWEAVEASVADGQQGQPGQAAADLAPPRTVSASRASDPFEDCFEEEEVVLDHYASLESQSRRQGRAVLSPQELEFAAALQTIFQPLPDADQANPPSDSPVDSKPQDVSATEVVAAAMPAPCEDMPVAVVLQDQTAEETSDGDEESPVTLQVEALRAVPPDDSDLIVVLDAEAHIAQLSRTPGKAHRQEYRRLFTKLREN